MNSVVIVGRVAYPKNAQTQTGSPVWSCKLKITRSYYKDAQLHELTNYIPVTAFGRAAETASQISEGEFVGVTGRLESQVDKLMSTPERKHYSLFVNVLTIDKIQELDSQGDVPAQAPQPRTEQRRHAPPQRNRSPSPAPPPEPETEADDIAF